MILVNCNVDKQPRRSQSFPIIVFQKNISISFPHEWHCYHVGSKVVILSTYHSTFTFNLKLKLFRSIPKNKIAYFELNDCELWKGNMKSCSFIPLWIESIFWYNCRRPLICITRMTVDPDLDVWLYDVPRLFAAHVGEMLS